MTFHLTNDMPKTFTKRIYNMHQGYMVKNLEDFFPSPVSTVSTVTISTSGQGHTLCFQGFPPLGK